MNSNTDILNLVIEQAFEGLENDFHKKNNTIDQGGWHQFLGSPKVGNVATAQALLLFKEFSRSIADKADAINFLVNNQIKLTGTTNDGGWSFISTLPGIANTESTSWVLLALTDELEPVHDCILQGIKWLKDNFTNENYSGWGPTRESGFRTYSTCIALKIFAKASLTSSNEYRAALETLKRIQNFDGGWGETSSAISTLSHTAHVILTLLDAGIKPTSRYVEKGLNWIANNLESKTYENAFHMGYSEMFDMKYSVGQDAKFQRANFYHLPIPYSILALIKGGYKNNRLIYQTIINLIEVSDIGVWRHPFLLEKPLWAIYDVMMLFNDFKESSYFSPFNEFVPKIIISKKFDVIIFTVVPIEFFTLNKLLNFADKDKKEDYSKNGYWYYEYTLQRNSGKDLSCLITMIGSAGDIGCYAACSTAFEEFDCDLAVLCGIAAGNKEDIKKYSALIAESVVAYEYQRIEINNMNYRPQYYSLDKHIKRLIDKRDSKIEEWMNLIRSYAANCGIELSEVKEYNVENTELKTGVIASGAKLIADGKTLEVLKENIPIGKGIIAAEMEGSGFAPCCEEYNKEWLVIRGISDYGEDDKNDKNNKRQQPLAVAAATATLIYYLKYLHRTIDERID